MKKMPSVQDLIAAVGSDTLTVTGADHGQCTAIAHKWEQMTGNPIVYGDAAQTYANAPAAQYTRIANSPTAVPPAGAIVVWGQNPVIGTGSAGHTSVATGDGDTNTFVSFDQNWPTGSKPRLVRHTYTGVIGWFIPNNFKGGEAMQGSQVLADETAVRLAFQIAFNREATVDDLKARVGRQSIEMLLRDVATAPEHGSLLAKSEAADPDKRIGNLKAALLEVLK
jgi:hypothetical protein